MGRQKQRQRERRKQRQTRAPQTGQKQTGQATTRGSGGRPVQPRSAPSSRGPNWGIIAAAAAVIIVALAVAGYGVFHGFSQSASPTATPRPTSTPLPTVSSAIGNVNVAAGKPVDGIQCLGSESLSYHIHQHLTLYDNGTQVTVPSEIGIPGTENNPNACFYWIHVHASTPGIIHVESPVTKTFNLGNFFDIWQVTRATTIPQGDVFVRKLKAAAQKGQVTAFLNGKRWQGSYRAIPLKEHAVITIEIGKPIVPPKPYNDWQGL